MCEPMSKTINFIIANVRAALRVRKLCIYSAFQMSDVLKRRLRSSLISLEKMVVRHESQINSNRHCTMKKV